MKSLNSRFPHSRQDSGQMRQDNSRPPTFIKEAIWNNPSKSPLSSAVLRLGSTVASSANHSKKSSISSNNGQTPTNVSQKNKRPEHQLNYYNVQNSQQQAPQIQQQKINNYLKENNSYVQPSAVREKEPQLQQQQSQQQQQQISFLNYLMMKDVQHEQEEQQQPPDQECVQKAIFNFRYVIGIGGFGKVWKVDHKKNPNQIFAMKEMSKALIITKKSVNSVMNERTILSTLKHPFLVNMHFAFQDRDNLFLVLDYMSGGDLRYHVGRMRRFNEDQTRFFMACIFLGLEHMHNNNIIHRDIKPENLVLDRLGYVRVTDMGIARILRPENAQDTSGTPGYMAPEVMCRQNHSFAVDYFALGVIGYEFMLGRRPYVGRSRKEIRDQILAKQVQIKRSDIPDGWSLEAADFINRLIQRKPANRIGFSGPGELRLHSWFKNFPWQKLLNKELKAPFIPSPKDDNFDAKQISLEDEENNELIQQNAMLLQYFILSREGLFSGYDFDNMGENDPFKKAVTQPKQKTHGMLFN